MAYVHCIAPCVGCKRLFGFNPNLVPSITIQGVKQAICRDCIDRANVKRRENGLDPIVPLPGAYEPADESAIVWED